jgi:hypothetical protein
MQKEYHGHLSLRCLVCSVAAPPSRTKKETTALTPERSRSISRLCYHHAVEVPATGQEKPVVTNTQLCLAVGIPMLFNAALSALFCYHMGASFDGANRRFGGMNGKFKGFNQRFDDLRDFWLSELHRFEGVLDARLKVLEQRRNTPPQ